MEEAGAVNKNPERSCKENGVSGNRANLAAGVCEEMTGEYHDIWWKNFQLEPTSTFAWRTDICQLRIRDGVNGLIWWK